MTLIQRILSINAVESLSIQSKLFFCRYRKYSDKEKIIKYGEDGNEFFIIIDGTVGIYTPKLTEFKMTLNELY